jgi:hypothetical protein
MRVILFAPKNHKNPKMEHFGTGGETRALFNRIPET